MRLLKSETTSRYWIDMELYNFILDLYKREEVLIPEDNLFFFKSAVFQREKLNFSITTYNRTIKIEKANAFIIPNKFDILEKKEYKKTDGTIVKEKPEDSEIKEVLINVSMMSAQDKFSLEQFYQLALREDKSYRVVKDSELTSFINSGNTLVLEDIEEYINLSYKDGNMFKVLISSCNYETSLDVLLIFEYLRKHDKYLFGNQYYSSRPIEEYHPQIKKYVGMYNFTKEGLDRLLSIDLFKHKIEDSIKKKNGTDFAFKSYEDSNRIRRSYFKNIRSLQNINN